MVEPDPKMRHGAYRTALRPMWDELRDPQNPAVRQALGVTCQICKAKPLCACRHPFESSEPLDRIVHMCRAQQHLDSKRAGDD